MNKLKAGFGFWDITRYDIGGKFTRNGESPLELKNIKEIEWCKGCTRTGETNDGRTIAFNKAHLTN
jgi:hypothetical protein